MIFHEKRFLKKKKIDATGKSKGLSKAADFLRFT